MNAGALERMEKAKQEALAAGDATTFLMAEHEWLRSVLAEMKAMVRPVTSEERKALSSYLSDLSGRLELHIRKEEEVFFPAIEPQMLEAGQGSTFDLYGEHDAIRIRRAQLAEAVASRADIPGAFAAFVRSISIHFDNEEELVFADALGWLTKEQGSSLIEQMQSLT